MSGEFNVKKMTHSKLFLDVAVLFALFAIGYFTFVFFGSGLRPTTSSVNPAAPYTEEQKTAILKSLSSSTSVNPARPYTAAEKARIQASLASSTSVAEDVKASQSH